MRRLLFVIIFLILQTSLLTLYLNAQQRGMGLIIDDDIEQKIPKKQRLLTRSYTSLPRSWSLKEYCPATEDQGIYQTCVGWATAYTARTIAEAVNNGWKNTSVITNEAFAPLYVYGSIKYADTKNCNMGTNLESAVKLMKNTGVVKKRSFDVKCAEYVSPKYQAEAAQYKIDDYFLLFGPNHTQQDAVNTTKKAIAENHPVVIAFKTWDSFCELGFDCWNGVADKEGGYHAMCVVGYDDDKYGGAFLLMNSWGNWWGRKGFAWVKYQDYSKHTHDALEIYVKAGSTNPDVNPSPKQEVVEKNKFEGSVSLKLSTGATLTSTLGTINGVKRYRVMESLTSGTRYRIYLGNKQPGYVYVISSDLNNNAAVNFPVDNHTSAAMTYSNNDFALPGETSWLEMDDTKGTDYLCVLYSKSALNTNSLLTQLKNGNGTFYERVQTALKKQLCGQSDISYKTQTMKFSATSVGTVVPVFVEITHK